MILNDKLKKIDLFKNLNDERIKQISSISRIKSFSRDNIIFYEGEYPDSFYLLVQGHVKLYKSDFKGNEIVLHYFSRPVMIAEMASLEDVNFPATAIATRDDVEIILVDKIKFVEMLKRDAIFSFYIIKSLTQKVKNLEVVINRNLVFDAMTKVCSFIKENHEMMENSKNKEIANILNMAPETLSRILTKLRKLDIINKNNIIIDNVKLNLILDI